MLNLEPFEKVPFDTISVIWKFAKRYFFEVPQIPKLISRKKSLCDRKSLEFLHCPNIVVIFKKAKKIYYWYLEEKKNLEKDSCDKVYSRNFVKTDFTEKKEN